MKDNDIVAEILSFDAMQAAEDLTGSSYKTDPDTESLGIGMMLMHNRLKEATLLSIGDTTLSNKLERYQAILSDIGFERAQSYPFEGHDGVKEALYVYVWREHGFVLVFDTYGGDSVNGGKVHYCVRPRPGLKETFYRATSSGRCESTKHPSWRRDPAFYDAKPDDLFWAGDHDCREALRHKLSGLLEVSEPLPKWPEPVRSKHKSGLFLTCYMDWHSKEYEGGSYVDQQAYLGRVYRDRFQQLPDWAQDVIGYSGQTPD